MPRPNLGTAAVLVCVLAAFLFVQHDDLQSQLDQADAQIEAAMQRQTDADLAAAREWAARQACGPAAMPEWLDDKSLVCHPKRGSTYVAKAGTP